MNGKQTLTAVCGAVALSFTTSGGAYASLGTTGNAIVNSPLTLLFLSFCALVVVVQCIPAITMFYRMFKGTFSAVEKKVLDEANNK
ncbi:MAG: hypothetical protein PHY09_05660 [Desulfuromonadaceae bacterium]|nr:hypothetical protein [Desulfuromonadaceae bacterium]MDD5107260.1 hypothetical protein [Desulfuromonadaceae bacterium]